MLEFEDRLARISNTSHIVCIDDMTIHKVSSVHSVCDDIYVQATDGLVFADLQVYTLEEAANIERKMINICRINGIKYND
jgi:hypothetical protein